MLEYEFERISVDYGVMILQSKHHQEVISRRAAEGWRYAGWIPASQVKGYMREIDLVFEREQEEPT